MTEVTGNEPNDTRLAETPLTDAICYEHDPRGYVNLHIVAFMRQQERSLQRVRAELREAQKRLSGVDAALAAQGEK